MAGFAYAIRHDVTLVKWLFVLGQAATLLYTLVQYRTTLLPLLDTAWWPAFTYVAFLARVSCPVRCFGPVAKQRVGGQQHGSAVSLNESAPRGLAHSTAAHQELM
jgi:hypothetical protein